MNETEALEFDKLLAGEIFTSRELQENLEILCDDFGSRFGGTESEKAAAEFLESKLREYALDNVRRDAFEYNGWTRGPARLTVTAPWERALECLSLPMSPPGRIQGRVVDLGKGAPNTFDALKQELCGNIALVSVENPPFETRWIQRTEKYNRSILAGAKAFIFVGAHDGLGPVTGALGFNRWGPIPGIMVSKEIGLLLQRTIRRKGFVNAEVETTDIQETKVSWNIIGELGDPRGLEEMVVVGVHYDGHDLAQGAMDPVSGTVPTLEIARAMSIHAGRLRRRIRFVFFGVEELGLIGAHAYVKRHDEDLRNTRFMLNLDSAGRPGPKGLILYGVDTSSYLRRLGQRMGVDLPVDVDNHPYSEPDHLSADHYPFAAEGIPSAFGGGPYHRWGFDFYHTRHDTTDKVDLQNMREAAFQYARIAWRIAAAADWPFKKLSDEEVYRRKVDYDAREEARYVEAALEQLLSKETASKS